MEKRMKKVCTDSQGAIHSPSPGSRPSQPSNPRRRAVEVSAALSRVASTVPRVRFSTRNNTATAARRAAMRWRTAKAIRRHPLIGLPPSLVRFAPKADSIYCCELPAELPVLLDPDEGLKPPPTVSGFSCFMLSTSFSTGIVAGAGSGVFSGVLVSG